MLMFILGLVSKYFLSSKLAEQRRREEEGEGGAENGRR